MHCSGGPYRSPVRHARATQKSVIACCEKALPADGSTTSSSFIAARGVRVDPTSLRRCRALLLAAHFICEVVFVAVAVVVAHLRECMAAAASDGMKPCAAVTSSLCVDKIWTLGVGGLGHCARVGVFSLHRSRRFQIQYCSTTVHRLCKVACKFADPATS